MRDLPQLLTSRFSADFRPIDLARRLDVGRSVVSNWATGVSVPDASKLPRLCEALEITAPTEVRELYAACKVPLPDTLFASAEAPAAASS